MCEILTNITQPAITVLEHSNQLNNKFKTALSSQRNLRENCFQT